MSKAEIMGNDDSMSGSAEVYVIIAAAGCGSRMGLGQGKQMLTVAGKTMIRRSCEVFAAHPQICKYLVLAQPEELRLVADELQDLKLAGKLLAVIPGGLSRQDTVLLGLRFYERYFSQLSSGQRKIVLVHDGARCLLEAAHVSACIAKISSEHCGAALAIAATDTIRVLRADGSIDSTPPRANTVQMQTPQGADFQVLLAASEAARRDGLTLTDDIQALEHIGYPVRLLPGSPTNLKLTAAADIALAEYYLSLRKKP